MKHIIFIGFALFCLLCFGCGDFLKEYSQDLEYATSCEDLDEILIQEGYMKMSSARDPYGNRNSEAYYPFLFVMDDDAEEFIATSSLFYLLPDAYFYYTWDIDPIKANNDDNSSLAVEEEDKTLSRLYKHIANINTLINYVDEFSDEPKENRDKILGESEFLRAAYYLMLNNLYGWAYDAKNKGTDLGVPVKTFEWVVDDYWSRATVAQVYELIVGDLQGAIKHLQNVSQPNFYRTNERASRILLSRAYLYMERYDDVIAQCDSVLAIGCPLSDLNMYNTEENLGNRDYLYDESNPEIVFTMGSTCVEMMFSPMLDGMNCMYSVSPDLLAQYKNDEKVQDLRRACYFMKTARIPSRFGVVKYRNQKWREDYPDILGWVQPKVFEAFLIRTVEVYLNKAEAQVMKGDVAGAISSLQPLLETRYVSGKLPQLNSFGEKELVEFIREERRRELCFEGHRWPDLKRYAVNTKYPQETTIRHKIYSAQADYVDGTYAGYYELGPYSEDDGWILPFPQSEITYNNGKLVNPKRPNRTNQVGNVN